MIVIDESGDLTIQVIEYEDGLKDIDSGDDGVYKTVNTNNQKPVIRHREEFRVCKNILTENSPVFKRLLTGWGFAEAEKDSITLKEDRVFAMGIWFRHMHGASVGDTKDVSLREMWHLTAAADKYDLCILDLKEWFADWYDRKPIINDDDGDNKKLLEARQLLYPCYRFNHARGFAIATKYLAYNSTGHITESNPTNHKELHLPSRMIQQINAAKGRFRTVIHSELFTPNERLLQADCSCKEATLFGYEKALYAIHVWPLERVVQRSTMTEILNRLEKFNYQPQRKACMRYCQKDYNSVAHVAQKKTREYFDGLCLDCMTHSKTQDYNKDYWCHNDLHEDEIVSGCRFEHKQPTWYFSFMGRQEERDHFRRRKQSGFMERFS